MVEPVSGDAPERQPTRRTGGVPVAPIIAMTLLIGLGAATSLFGSFLPMASANCPEDDPRLICSADGQSLVVAVPILSAGLGVVVAAVGIFRWPRGDWAYWAIGGFTVTLIGFTVACGIAGTAP